MKTFKSFDIHVLDEEEKFVPWIIVNRKTGSWILTNQDEVRAQLRLHAELHGTVGLKNDRITLKGVPSETVINAADMFSLFVTMNTSATLALDPAPEETITVDAADLFALFVTIHRDATLNILTKQLHDMTNEQYYHAYPDLLKTVLENGNF